MTFNDSPDRVKAPAAGEAFMEHLDALYRYALALTRNKKQAERLVEETYRRALGSSDRNRHEGDSKSSLLAILRQLYLSVDRQNRPMCEVAANETNALQSALSSLPALHHEVLVLHEFEGLSYRELADVLGCTVGTAVSHLCLARESLRQSLKLTPPARS